MSHTNDERSTDMIIKRSITLRTIILACLSSILCASAAAFSVTENGILFFSVNSLQSCLVLIVTVGVFISMQERHAWDFRSSVLIVSALFSIMTVVGLMLDGAGSLQISGIDLAGRRSYSNGMVSTAAIAMMVCGYSLFYYLMVLWLYGNLHKIKISPNTGEISLFGRALDLRLCAVVMIVAWLPYVIVFFPGLPTSDTSRQMAQFYEVGELTLDTHFPYFVSLLYGRLYSLGLLIDPSGCLGLLLMTLAQVSLGAFVFSVITIWVKCLGAPRWLVLSTLAFFALFPLVPVYMVSIGKDTLHAELLALFAFQLFMLFRQDDRKIPCELLCSPLVIGANALLISLTRNGSILIVMAALLMACLLLRKGTIALAGTVVLSFFCAWQFLALPAFGVQGEGPKEMLSVPAQIVASYVHDDLPLDEATRERLDGYFGGNLDTAAAAYVNDWSDMVKIHLTLNSTTETLDFLKLSMSIALQNPLHAIGAALSTTYGTWYPFTFGTYFIEDAPYPNAPDSEWAHPEWLGSSYDFEKIDAKTAIPNALLRTIHVIPGISLLYAPGFYTWLIVLLLGFSCYEKANRGRMLTVLSPFLALIAIMIAGPCASLRYALPMVFSLPLFAMLAGTERMFVRECHDPIQQTRHCSQKR